jgi:hypothetical membrane protein
LKTILAPIAYILIFILVAQLFAPPEYRWVDNSISELAAQGLPNGWIMRAGLAGFGPLLISVLARRMLTQKRVRWPDTAVALYALSILVTGIFSAGPFLEGVPFSAQEAQLHTVFASLAGFFLTLGILLALVQAPGARAKRGNTIFLLLVVGFSALFGLADGGDLAIGKGLIQRLLWLSGFGWLHWWF